MARLPVLLFPKAPARARPARHFMVDMRAHQRLINAPTRSPVILCERWKFRRPLLDLGFSGMTRKRCEFFGEKLQRALRTGVHERLAASDRRLHAHGRGDSISLRSSTPSRRGPGSSHLPTASDITARIPRRLRHRGHARRHRRHRPALRRYASRSKRSARLAPHCPAPPTDPIDDVSRRREGC